jgi:hypothetical protein
MRFARLFTPFVLAAALVAPAAMPAAHAATDARMGYAAKSFHPLAITIRKSQALIVTNLDTRPHQFKVSKSTSQLSGTLQTLDSFPFTLWQTEGPGLYKITETSGDAVIDGTIEVIDQ